MTRKKLPITLELEEAQNLLKQPSKRYPTGLRNKAMLSVMLNCGLRVSEVVNLRPGNINLTKGKKLSIKYLQQMVKRYARKAGINKRISPHTLRHYVERYIMVSVAAIVR